MGQAEEVFSREFDAIFLKLDSGLRQQIESKITELGARLDRFPHHRLRGRAEFRLRVGDWRIIYQFDVSRNMLYLITLGNRREVYKR